MLTKDEQRFVDYWKDNRELQKKTFRQWVIGLPIGMSFGAGILLIFTTGWYERANITAYSSSSPVLFLLAIVIIISFIAIFSKKHKWDMNEQRYLELLARQKRSEDNATPAEENRSL